MQIWGAKILENADLAVFFIKTDVTGEKMFEIPIPKFSELISLIMYFENRNLVGTLKNSKINIFSDF